MKSLNRIARPFLQTILFCVFCAPCIADQLKLVVQPIYPPEQTKEAFAPLVRYLNEVSGHTITLVAPKNYHIYWADLRKSEDWDLIYDDAHITDYVINKYGYEPLSKTTDKASFALISGTGRNDETLKDFIAKRVVSMPAPSLGFSLLNQWYDSPLQQPVIISTASSWRDTVQIVFEQEAQAAMVPTWMADEYPNLLKIAVTDEMPGAAISASPNVSSQTRRDIQQALNALHDNKEYYEALVELHITQFETAKRSDYVGMQDLLKGYYGF